MGVRDVDESDDAIYIYKTGDFNFQNSTTRDVGDATISRRHHFTTQQTLGLSAEAITPRNILRLINGTRAKS